MVSLKHLIFGKSVIAIASITEETREGVQKAYIPKWLFKPPYGYPRYANMSLVRWLAKTPYADMCITTIIDELTSIPWDVVIEPGFEDDYTDEEGNINPNKQKEIDHIKKFFNNPNTNNETFEDVFIEMPMRDILEVNAGILNKVFNLQEDLVEVVARDGASFTKNPDIHGMFTDRVDVLIPKTIVNNPGEVVNVFEQVHATRARDDAAYFQYGWVAGPMPIPFGRREIIWLEKMKRTDEIYGYSPIQVLANSLQMLIWMIESDLEYFNDNNVPKGIIGLDDADSDDIEAFRDQWYNNQRKKDEFGNYKKMMHKVPIVNKIPKFTRIEFSASEMQLIEKQKWYSKMVWACFGVTATELGYTEDAQGQANQIVQSKVFRKKAINPMLRKLSSHYNKEIVSEFGYEHLQFKFLIFDIDEEKSKYELFKLQTESGLKTINEIRQQEGLEVLDWGDKPPKDWQQSENTYNMNGFGEKPFGEREEEAQETDEARKLPEKREDDGKPPKEEKKGVETKPFAGYRDFADCVRKNQDKKNPEAYCAVIQRQVEGKDLSKEEKEKLDDIMKYMSAKYKKTKTEGKDNPLILGENERPTDYKRLEKAIVYLLKQNEDGIKDILESEMKENAIAGLKDINSVIAKIKALLSFEGLRQITNAMMKNNYLEGWDEAEEQMDRNYVPDSDAIDYLSDYTFGNIKGMNDDIANKLRQELQRGFMDGEGITQIKDRVKKVFDVGENRAEMIARTETTRSSNFGKLHAYQKAGVKGKKRWLTHFDNRTSDVCKRLDGQEVGIDEDFHDAKTGWKGKVPPAHVSCRSDWIFVPE